MGFAAVTKSFQDKEVFDVPLYQNGSNVQTVVKAFLSHHISWNDSYSVGVRQLDEHHKRLFSIINEACDACARGNYKAFPLILDELLDYVLYHFEAEEKYMIAIKYPELEAHQIEHQQFAEKLIGYHRMVQENNQLFSIKLIDLTHYIYKWWCEHILKKDMQFSGTSF